MTKPKKPACMDRREFLQFAGSGLLFSIVATRVANAGATTENVTFASDGFSLTLHFPPGGVAQFNSLQPKDRF